VSWSFGTARFRESRGGSWSELFGGSNCGVVCVRARQGIGWLEGTVAATVWLVGSLNSLQLKWGISSPFALSVSDENADALKRM
jgi:hypothetical protein